MQCLGQHLARFSLGPGCQVFEEKRKIIRKFLLTNGQPVFFVDRHQVDHRLAAIPAFTMNMLKKVQCQRPGAVEQMHITLLHVVEIAIGDVARQSGKQLDLAPAGLISLLQDLHQLGQGRMDFLCRIGQQDGGCFECRDHQVNSLNRSVGVCVVRVFLPPNRSLSASPVEQPLPKEKPQEPRRS